MTDLSDDTAAAGGRDAPNVRSHKNYFISDVFTYEMFFHIRCIHISNVHPHIGLFIYQVYLRIRCLFISNIFTFEFIRYSA